VSTWTWVLVACAAAFLLKLAGYLVPDHLLDHPALVRVSALLPVALLAALVAVQSVGGPGGTLVLDARLAGVAVAVVALLLRAPFLVVITLAAATAAGVRALGWAA
jgi:Branched-chain amino acid transport protein (AzlD)